MCNRRSTAMVFRKLVKTYKSLKGTEPLDCRYTIKNMKNLSKFTGKKTLMESFYCKVVVFDFTEKELHHRCFPITIPYFFRTAALEDTCKRLLLKEQLVKPKVKVSNHTANFFKKENATQVSFCKNCIVFFKHSYRTPLGHCLWNK